MSGIGAADGLQLGILVIVLVGLRVGGNDIGAMPADGSEVGS